MADPVTIKLTGFKELGDKLRAFGPRIAAKGLRGADFAGATYVLNAVLNTVPVRSGVLKANLYPSRRKTPDNVVEYSIIVRRHAQRAVKVAKHRKGKHKGSYHQLAGPELYGPWVEFGNSRIRPHPFMRPAFESSANGAIDAIKGALQAAVDATARS